MLDRISSERRREKAAAGNSLSSYLSVAVIRRRADSLPESLASTDYRLGCLFYEADSSISSSAETRYRGRTTFDAVGGRPASLSDITESLVCGL